MSTYNTVQYFTKQYGCLEPFIFYAVLFKTNCSDFLSNIENTKEISSQEYRSEG